MIKKTRNPKSKNYFTHDTELAIVRYNKEKSPVIRSRIYEEEIHYPFFKLTQNIIHTFKFYHMVYDYYKSLDGNYELQKDLMKEVKKEFRVSYVTIFSVLKYFKES